MKRKPHKVSFEQTKVNTWFERDRAHVELCFSIGEERTILGWWDEQVADLVEDGFLTPRDWHRSAYDYAVHLGIVEVQS